MTLDSTASAIAIDNDDPSLPAPDPTVTEKIVQELLAVDEIDLAEIRTRFADIGHVKLEITIHAARERVRLDHNIDFAPVKGQGGVIRRADKDRIVKRSERGRRAGLKKLERAADRMSLAALKAGPDEQEKLEKRANQQRTVLTAASMRGERLRKLLKK